MTDFQRKESSPASPHDRPERYDDGASSCVARVWLPEGPTARPPSLTSRRRWSPERRCDSRAAAPRGYGIYRDQRSWARHSRRLAPTRIRAVFPGGPGPLGRTGAGLGLAIAKKIIQRNGGRLTLVNAPAGGLIQSVELPVAKAPRL